MELKKQELQQLSKDFFNTNKKEVVQSLTGESMNVIKLDFDQVKSFSPELSFKLQESPEDTLAVMEDVLGEMDVFNIKNPRIRFKNFSAPEIKIRELRSKHLDNLLVTEGIVRQASDVRPQVVNARFECPTCGAVLSVLQIDRKFREPSRCSCGRKGLFKLLSKEMIDAQRLVIEESPDSLSGGEQPRRMNVFLKEDLVDPKMEERTTPGSKIKIIGVLKEVPVPMQTGSISTRFDLAIEANNVVPLEETFEDLQISEEEEKQIEEIARSPKVYEKLARSIAPSVYGFERVKEALLLQLFSGVKKIKSDGGSSRSDIHILLVGDPGVAKSVTLKFISSIAPRGRYVSGKATTGAGLTASVVKDEFLRGWALEAGAMVLANKGIVCIDEIEKMGEDDRSTMHEAMEQQCYHHDTIITLADGSERKIGELVEEMLESKKEKIINGKDCLILPAENLEILTTDWKNVFKTKASRVSKHKAFDKFVKIKFSHGREITVTPEHPVFTAENGNIITRRADQIKIGDPIPIPLIMPVEGAVQKFGPVSVNPRAINHIRIPESNSEELFKIAGYFISEGSREINRKKVIGINFTNKDQRLLDDFEKCMAIKFGLSPYKQAKVDEHDLRYMYRYTSRELAEFLLSEMPEMMRRSGEKEIPQILMKGRKQDIAKMLSALFEGDGYASVKKRTIRIGYKTKSKRLAQQIQDLLLRFNIRSSITQDRIYYRVGITDYSNISNFQSSIGFITEEKNRIIEVYLKEKIIRRHVKNRLPEQFNEKIISIMKDEEIKRVGKCNIYGIIYDHQKRKPAFSFSTQFIKDLIKLVKKEENKLYLSQFISDIGWERVSGIEIMENEGEGWVYDVTIEPNHSFVSQAAILHNTITISKANIHATLRAETSVLAAGNPKLGRFDPFTPIPQQIDISPALLSRFDVIFILRDLPNKAQDEAIATHVLEEHKQEVVRDVVDPNILRKYISYARKKYHPKLTEEAVEEIKEFYVKLRNQSVRSEGEIKPIPITARQLEAIVRLSEACAKIRFSHIVERKDTLRAIELLKFSLTQVGYDEETKTFDIDRVTTGISTSKRSKIVAVKEILSQLESKVGKLIPMEELEAVIQDKMTREELEDSLDQLVRTGDIFRPKKGFVQKI